MFENQIYVIAKPIFNFNILWLKLGIFFVFYRTSKKRWKKREWKKKRDKSQNIKKSFVLWYIKIYYFNRDVCI